MFVVTLRFSSNKARAPTFMEAHNAWIARGFEDGVFLLVGGLGAGEGGAILAHQAQRPELERRVADDPFVAHGIVDAEIIEISAARADDRLSFLLG